MSKKLETITGEGGATISGSYIEVLGCEHAQAPGEIKFYEGGHNPLLTIFPKGKYDLGPSVTYAPGLVTIEYVKKIANEVLPQSLIDVFICKLNSRLQENGFRHIGE